MTSNESAPINPEDSNAKQGRARRAIKRIFPRSAQAPADVESMMKTTTGLDTEAQSKYRAALEWANNDNSRRRVSFTRAQLEVSRSKEHFTAARKEFGGYKPTDFKQPAPARPSNAIQSVDLAAQLGEEAEDHLRDINRTNVSLQDVTDLKSMEDEQFSAADLFDKSRELPTTAETFQGSRFQLELQTNDVLADKDYTDSAAMYGNQLNFTPHSIGFDKPENTPPAEQGPLPPLPPISEL